MENNDKHKILLADNEPQKLKNLLKALNPDRYRGFVASNGKLAVEQALKKLSESVIRDSVVPKMNSMIHRFTAIASAPNDYTRNPLSPSNLKSGLKIDICQVLFRNLTKQHDTFK